MPRVFSHTPWHSNYITHQQLIALAMVSVMTSQKKVKLTVMIDPQTGTHTQARTHKPSCINTQLLAHNSKLTATQITVAPNNPYAPTHTHKHTF